MSDTQQPSAEGRVGLPLPESPYRGLEPYRYCDRMIFFEREIETERLLRLTTIYRGALLYGESGVGKSSLINAGFIPRVAQEGATVERLRVQPRSEREFVVERIPRLPTGDEFLPSLLADGQANGKTIFSATEFYNRVRALSGRRLLLVFDQYEELLTLTSDTAEQADALECRRRILDAIVAILHDRKIQETRLLFVFREDYLAKFEQFFYFCPELPDQFLRITAPQPSALKRIIRGPFESHKIPPGHWASKIPDEVAGALENRLRPAEQGVPINLSQVQIAALQLWRSESPAALLQVRGIDGLIADYLQNQVKQFRGDQRVAETLLSLMITTQGTRKVIESAELAEQACAWKIAQQKVDSVLERLVTETRLVRRDYNRGATTYEIVSEFLVPWIRELRLRRLAREARVRWIRRASVLLTGMIVILGAIFAERYRSTTVAAQQNRLVREARMQADLALRQSKQAEAQTREMQRQLDETRIIMTQGKGQQLGALTAQLNDVESDLVKERARSADLVNSLERANAEYSDAVSANKNLLQRIEALEKSTLKPDATASAVSRETAQQHAPQPITSDAPAATAQRPSDSKSSSASVQDTKTSPHLVPQSVGDAFAYQRGKMCTIRTAPVKIPEGSYARLFELPSGRDLYLFVQKIAHASGQRDDYALFKITREARNQLTDRATYPEGASPESFLSSRKIGWMDSGHLLDAYPGNSSSLGGKDPDYRLNFVDIDRDPAGGGRSVTVNVCAVWQ